MPTERDVRAPAPPGAARARRIGVAVVLLATALAYAGSLSNGFVGWDDPQLVTENPTVRLFDWRGIATDYTQSTWHPLTLLSYAVEHACFGLNPFVFHSTNVALHALSSALVLLLAARLLPGARVAPAVAALLFALHPLHVESVAWVSERKDVLSTFFSLAALLAYVAARDAGRPPGWRPFALFGLALLSKPMAVTLPVVMVALDLLRERRWRVSMVASKWAYFVASLTVGLVNLRGQSTAEIVEAEPLRLQEALGNAWNSLVFYVDKTVRPVELSVYYDDRVLEIGGLETAVFALAVLAVALHAWRRPERRALVAFGVAWFLVTIALVLKLVPFGEHSLVNDRYMYLPSVGLFLIAGAAAEDLWRAARARGAIATGVVAAAGVLAAFACGVGTHARAAVWRDDGTLWNDVLTHYPDTPKAHEYVAYHYFEAGDGRTALEHMQAAARLDPTSASLHQNLGAMYGNLGFHAEARAAFERCVEVDPDSVEARTNLGIALAVAGEEPRAEEHLRRAVELAPGYAPPLLALARIVAARGDVDEAVRLLESALAAAPWEPELHAALIRLLAASGRSEEARAWIERAARARIPLPPDLR